LLKRQKRSGTLTLGTLREGSVSASHEKGKKKECVGKEKRGRE